MKRKRKPKWQNRMMRFNVRFSTYNLRKGSDDKTVTDKGIVEIENMPSRSIKRDRIVFYDIREFLLKFQKLMDKHKIKILDSKKLKFIRLV